MPNYPTEPNAFVLKKLPSLKLKNTLPKCVIADFSPSLCNPHQLNPLKKKYVKTLVNYNNDGLFYTPGFMVPYYDVHMMIFIEFWEHEKEESILEVQIRELQCSCGESA